MKYFSLVILLLFAATAAAQDRIARISLHRGTAAPTVAEVSTVVAVADVGGALGGKYFILPSALDAVKYAVWIDVDNCSTAPTVAGATLVEVDVAEDAANTAVASAISAALDALPAFGASVDTATVTITNAAKGATTDIAAGTSGFTVGVSTQGVSSTPAISTSNLQGDVVLWKICNDATNTSTHLFVGLLSDTEQDGIMLGKGQCFECNFCRNTLLKDWRVTAQAASNGYSVTQYRR